MNWAPGHIANGHQLGTDGIWHPIAPYTPPPRKPVWQRGWAITLYITGGLLVALTVIGLMFSTTPNTEPDVTVGYEQLIDEFNQGRDAAHEKYDGKTLGVTGVAYVDPDNGEVSVNGGGKWDVILGPEVTCEAPQGETQNDEKITLLGQIDEVHVSEIKLRNCAVAER